MGIFIEFLFGLLHPSLEWLLDSDSDWGRSWEKKRQARACLKDGRALLAEGSVKKANFQFGIVLSLCPDLAFGLSKRQRRKLIDELEPFRFDKRHQNVLRLWIRLKQWQRLHGP